MGARQRTERRPIIQLACRRSASLTDQLYPSINVEGVLVRKMPTAAIAGLWSAITVAALGIVVVEQSSPIGTKTAAAQTTAAIDPTVTAPIILTDATGNRYRKRRD